MISKNKTIEVLDNSTNTFEDLIRSEYANGEFQFSLKKYYDLHNAQCVANGMPEEVIQARFNDWVRNLFDGADFEEGFSFAKILVNESSRKDGRGGRKQTDYICTADMIKEVGMLTKTKVGTSIRRAFIAIEKKYKAAKAIGVIDDETDALVEAIIHRDKEAQKKFLEKMIVKARVAEHQLVLTEEEFDKYKERWEGVKTRTEYVTDYLEPKGYVVAKKRCGKPNVSDILDGKITYHDAKYKCDLATQSAIDEGYCINVVRRSLQNGHKCVTVFLTPKGQRYCEQFFACCKTTLKTA